MIISPYPTKYVTELMTRENTKMIVLVESPGFQVKYAGSEAFVTLKLR